MIKISRRNFLTTFGVATLIASISPRIVFAGQNILQNIRTGVQPGNKTRIVIETTKRPSYSLSYDTNKLIINLLNTNGNAKVLPVIVSGTLISRITQIQTNSTLQIVVGLTSQIDEIQKNQTMILEPNGDNDYRLVFDFSSGTGVKAKNTIAAKSNDNIVVKKHIIVIDAGHGGKDPGCISKNGTKEKDIVLSVAKKLKTKLDSDGYTTYLTRNKDEYLKLAERAEIAERLKAELFISLHANANPSRQMKGFSVYTLSEKASDEEAQKLADSENAADKIDVNGFEQFSKDIRIALSALQQHAVAELSEEYANSCAKYFTKSKIEQQPGPLVRHAPFAVLRSTVPGALIELGHLTNTSEEKLLKTNDYQIKLVEAIEKSINNYNFDV